MGYRIRETGEYVATEFGLREHFKGTTAVPIPLTPEWLDANGVDPVFEGPQASGGTVYQYSQAAGIEQGADGKWYTKYVLGPIFQDTEDATAAEQEAEYKARRDAEQAQNVRRARNAKLAETDWVVIKAVETGTAVPADLAAQRQALRDITAQAGFPWTIDWPDAS